MVKRVANKIKGFAGYKKPAFLLIGLSLVVNFALGLLLLNSWPQIKKADDFNKAQKQYPLLSKRVLQDFPQDILINFLDLRTQLRETVNPWESSFGFYFEYLPTGVSIGINEKEEFYAASLFKVPVIMAYYNKRESDGLLGDEQFTVLQEDIDSQFGTLWKKGVGYKIKSSEAIRLALEESDNTAAKIIARSIRKESFQNVYDSIDIDLSVASGGAILTTKNYTSILKALYFSAVLQKNDSQAILDMLTKSKFNDKLVAGVGNGIVVAHKIGDYTDRAENTAFMDCGIVYVPRRPYSLCMISVGDEETARERMSKVSKMIYDYVSKAD